MEFEPTRPTPEHLWLKQLIGEWRVEVPKDHPGPQEGYEVTTAFGDYWVSLAGTMLLDGVVFGSTIIQIGFDAKTGKFVGSFIGTVMPEHWIYSGYLSEDKKSLILESEGESFEGDGKIRLYRDIIEVVSSDHRIFRSECKMDDGSWKQFMFADLHRKS
jgi:hypothetical protein